MDYNAAFAKYQDKIAFLSAEVTTLEASVAAVNDQIKAKKKELNKLTGTLREVAPELFPAKAAGRPKKTEPAPEPAPADADAQPA